MLALRLTSFGWKSGVFYLALVGAFFASPYSNLFFLLLSFLTLAGLASVVWTRRNLRGVTARVLDGGAVAAGSESKLEVLVSADKRCSAFQIGVELELERGPRGGPHAAQADWVEGERTISLSLPPLPRGIHPVRAARVFSTYPLGVLRAHRTVDAPPELVVYPRPAALVNAHSAAEVLAELTGESLSGGGELQPSGLRDHREGDELRSIHWRASARRGKPVVREWEGGDGQGLEVQLDRRCEPAALEEALESISALVTAARSSKEILAITTQGLVASFGDGHRPWSEALRFLAGATVLPAGGPAPPPVSPSVKRFPVSMGHARG